MLFGRVINGQGFNEKQFMAEFSVKCPGCAIVKALKPNGAFPIWCPLFPTAMPHPCFAIRQEYYSSKERFMELCMQYPGERIPATDDFVINVEYIDLMFRREKELAAFGHILHYVEYGAK